MMYPFLTLNDQEGRLLSRQKTRGPQDKHLRDFLTPCGLHNSRFDPMLYLLDPTFPGWGHCIKIRVICQKRIAILTRQQSFFLPKSALKHMDYSHFISKSVNLLRSTWARCVSSLLPFLLSDIIISTNRDLQRR